MKILRSIRNNIFIVLFAALFSVMLIVSKHFVLRMDGAFSVRPHAPPRCGEEGECLRPRLHEGGLDAPSDGREARGHSGYQLIYVV